MKPGELLRALHGAAQAIREESLAHIDASPRLAARVEVALLVIAPVDKFLFEHQPEGIDERTCQLLLVRFKNFLQAAREMALQGFYQVALAAARDASVTGHLLAFFGKFPDKIEPWRNSELRERTGRGEFSPGSVLKALGKEETVDQIRGEIHGALSDSASHPTFGSRGLLASDGEPTMIHPGAFFDGVKLEMVITTTLQAALDVLDDLPKVFPTRPKQFDCFLEANLAEVSTKTKYIADNFPSPENDSSDLT